ncbi:YdaS family helix-turn-helix protein [Pseudoxanthomonas sp. JBR18]|uniref:transcriptional regulator n=1 Tax=Pseudoxanthomonas sp. JBR18 TaxID=2969308 RepID=UPI002305124A|nr:YdaS family helix-turn-helix protein [Pseudoxanthomonas sp. JBR18]WCE04461.1 YdaS family helix-turn-helix protein [Pseudoxanthomonas sp. JBR18]
MDILSFRKTHGLSQSALAAYLTERGVAATQGLVSQWEKGATIPAERVVEIERATEGAVQRGDLRPDLWPADSSEAA